MSPQVDCPDRGLGAFDLTSRGLRSQFRNQTAPAAMARFQRRGPFNGGGAHQIAHHPL
jgi:hypothetical protein